MQQDDYQILIVEHKDRLARFGIRYMELLLKRLEVKLEVVNLAENGKDELMQDLVAIITSFAARLYGQRRAKRKTEKIIETLQDQTNNEDTVSYVGKHLQMSSQPAKVVYIKEVITFATSRKTNYQAKS